MFFFLNLLFSELMQNGASMSGSQLLKIITKGKTDQLSAAAMIEFFRPLESWLEQQNRNEPVVGWNSNMDDVALFQQFNRGSCRQLEISIAVTILISLASILIL